MPEAQFKSGLLLGQRAFVAIVFVIMNTFTWYLLAFRFFRGFIESASLAFWEVTLLWGIHFGGIIGAALIGAAVSKKNGTRNTLIILWICLGIVSSLTFIFLHSDWLITTLITALLLGVSFGLGLPTSLGFFADTTLAEKRGRLGGIIWFSIAIGSASLGITTLFVEDPLSQSIIATIWRTLALFAFLVFKPNKLLSAQYNPYNPSYLSILQEKRFIYYFIPWTTFCLINWLITPILSAEILYTSTLLEFALTSLFALIGGFLSDIVGRKPVIIFGFIMLGLGYAALGIGGGPIIYYLYTIMDGIAWGMFGAVFLMVLWGDMSHNIKTEKYYALGGIPYPLAGFLREIVAPQIAAAIPLSAAFPFASLFLFLAIMPLLYAVETLPEEKIRRRQFQQYVEKAKDIKEKYKTP